MVATVSIILVNLIGNLVQAEKNLDGIDIIDYLRELDWKIRTGLKKLDIEVNKKADIKKSFVSTRTC